MRILLLLASGCGLGWVDGKDDRTAGLPTSGAGPYERLARDDNTPATEPRFLDEIRADLDDPSMLAGGAGIRVWFTRRTADPVTSEIQYTEAVSPRELPSVGPMPVLNATEAWEEGVVGSPSVVADPAGGLVMFYEGGVAMPSIGRAVSSDGITWEKDALPVLAGASSPSGVFVDGETWLFVTRPGEPGIWRAVDGAFDAAPVIAARPELPEAFDRLSVSDPFALVVPRLDGADRIHLWFAGTTDTPTDAIAIGYAASFDGVEWLRFGGDKPMLIADGAAPTVILEASRGLMLFTEPLGGNGVLSAADH
jgi:hypothetical protein